MTGLLKSETNRSCWMMTTVVSSFSEGCESSASFGLVRLGKLQGYLDQNVLLSSCRDIKLSKEKFHRLEIVRNLIHKQENVAVGGK